MPPDTLPLIMTAGCTAAGICAISFLLARVWAAALPGRALYYLFRTPGIVLHECAHIAGCLITGARIRHIVLISTEGGSVTYSRPALPLLGDLVISTAPLLVLPAFLLILTGGFSAYLGCVFPVFTAAAAWANPFESLPAAIAGILAANLVTQFNPWFIVYLYLGISIVLAIAPSMQDMKNAAGGFLLISFLIAIAYGSGIATALSLIDMLVSVLMIVLVPGLLFSLGALALSLPLIFWLAWSRLF